MHVLLNKLPLDNTAYPFDLENELIAKTIFLN